MKKNIVLIICVIILKQFSFGQICSKREMNFSKVNEEKVSLVNEDDNFVNVYYGPSIITSAYKKLAAVSGLNVRVNSNGNLGFVYERVINDVIGVGCEIGYAKYILKYDLEYTNANGNKLIANEQLDIVSYRINFRANFHFIKSDKFDAYGLLSAGFRGSNYQFKSSIPKSNNSVTYFKTSTLIPFVVKPGVGFRYFFAPIIGINLELAVGTPLICGGLSFKFN